MIFSGLIRRVINGGYQEFKTSDELQSKILKGGLGCRGINRGLF